jgi:hypothetical protein
MENILFILAGFITGISIGVIGIGAGVLLMPMLIFMGVPIKSSVAIGLALQVVPQSLPGMWLYYKNGHFNIKIALLVILGSLIGTTFGSYLVNYNFIGERDIYIALFIFMMISTIMIGYDIYYNRLNR